MAGVLLLGLAAAIAMAITFTSRASAGPAPTFDITGNGSTAGTIAAETWTAADQDLKSATGTVQLPVERSGFAGTLVSTNLTLDDTSVANALILQGTTTVLGHAADVYILGQWLDTTSDNSPTFTTVLHFAPGLTLADFTTANPSLPADLSIGLSDVWLGMTTSSSGVTIPAGAVGLDPAAPFTVGASSNPAVTPSGITFRAGLASGNVGDLNNALTQFGVSGGVRLDGALSGVVTGFPTSKPSISSALSLTATLDIAAPQDGTWFKPDPSYSLTVAGDTSGNISATLSGGATLTVGGTDYTVSPVVLAVARDDSTGVVTVDLSASLQPVSGAFNQSWLDLNSITFDAKLTIDKGTVSFDGSLAADTSIDGTDFKVAVAISKGADTSAQVDISTDATLSSTDLLGKLDPSLSIDNQPDIQLSHLKIHVDVGGGTYSVVVGGTGSLVLPNKTSLGVDALFRYDKGGDFLIAARTDTSTSASSPVYLHDLVNESVSPDLQLPDVTFLLAKQDIAAGALDDPPSTTFFGGANPAIDTGADIRADIYLPSDLSNALTAVGIDTSGPLTIDGHLPIFNGTTTSLTITLPQITSEKSAVHSVSLSLGISKTGTVFTFDIDGTMQIAAPRQNPADCNPYSGEDPANVVQVGGNCADLVEFDVSAGLTFGDPNGFEVDFNGHLGEWDHAMGVSWLTIKDANLTFKIEKTGVTVGLSGQFEFGEASQFDLTVAFEATAMDVAPYIKLDGFTFGSNSGLTLDQLRQLYESISGQHANVSMPPVGVRNLWLSFGTVDDPANCIRKGFYLSGDLYLTNSDSPPNMVDQSTLTPTASGSFPGCSTTDNPTADNPGQSTQCSAAPKSCLASILIDLDPDKPSFTAAGHVTAWHAGPVQFGDADASLVIDLSNSPPIFQLHLSGSATLLDPVAWAKNQALPQSQQQDPSTLPVWASGGTTIDVGTENLDFDGSLVLKTTPPINAHVHAAGSLDLSNPGFNMTSWFPVQQFQEAGQKIKDGIESVNQTATAFIATYTGVTPADVTNDIHTAFQALGQNDNPVSQWQDFLNLYNTVNDQLNGSKLFQAFKVLTGLTNDDVFRYVMQGVHCCSGAVDIPGVCHFFPQIDLTALCKSDNPAAQVAELQSRFADTEVESQLQAANLSRPNGSTDSDVVKQIASFHAPVTPNVVSSFATTNVSTPPPVITCAAATESYQGQGQDNPIDFGVNQLGANVVIQGTTPLNDPTNDSTLPQSTLNALVSGTNTGDCPDDPGLGNAPQLTLSLDQSRVLEGSSVAASGFVADSGVTSVSIDWGDSSDSTSATVTNHQYSATHTYYDESAGGKQAPFTVTATATGSTPVTRTIGVIDSTPSVAVAVSPTEINQFGAVTLTGTVTDIAPQDSHTVDVDWADGTVDGAVPVDSNGQFTLHHVYIDAEPGGQATADEVIQAVAHDDDGTASPTATADVTVHDVAPTTDSLTATAGALTASNTVFTHAGTAVTWAGQASDLSPDDVLNIDANWADGTPDGTTQASAVASDPYPQAPTPLHALIGTPAPLPRSFGLTHAFPTPCLDMVGTKATDEDLLPSPALLTTVVVTAPLGALPQGPGYWDAQARALAFGKKAQFSPAQFGCYLRISQYLAPTLSANTLTPSVADGLLEASGAKTALSKEIAKLKRAELTALLDFANGSWDWNTRVLADGTTFGTLIQRANTVSTSTSVSNVMAVRTALDRIV